VNFLTAALGHKKYMKAANRLKKNVLEIGQKNELTIYDETKLFETYPRYESLFLKNHIVGFGAWIWKPLIIQSELRKLKENDILIYLDVGCEVNLTPDAIEKLTKYVNLSKEKGIVVFENSQLEKNYTYKSVYSFFSYEPMNVENDIQISASILIISNIELSRNIVNKWAAACLYKDGILAFNRNDVTPEANHRNDQSILSVLLKTTKQGMILPNESYFSTGDYLKKFEPYLYPFHTTRNFTEWSFLKMYYFFNNTMKYLPLKISLFVVKRCTYAMVHVSLLKLKFKM